MTRDGHKIISRYLVLARDPIIPKAYKPFKTSIVLTLNEGTGGLFKALAVFALRDINLSKIHGRQPENAIITIPSCTQPSPSSSSRTHLQRGKLKQIQKQNRRREFHVPLLSTVAPATAFQPSSITIIGLATLRQKPLIVPLSPERRNHLPRVAFGGAIFELDPCGGKQQRDSNLGLPFSVRTWMLTSPSSISPYPPTMPMPWSSCLESLLLPPIIRRSSRTFASRPPAALTTPPTSLYYPFSSFCSPPPGWAPPVNSLNVNNVMVPEDDIHGRYSI
ncbi:hypothetical protein LR48_Vigan01g147000 [Vigna angularis]|uniref:Uncharacterized protein n=1 Tax=Phaseolus angularis TaxID=3914 RepID=A0A0L9TP27_PHAAN|nr:hypothetical protein LR48_Vigan01g147000 [Vigna angularis]